MKDSGTNFRIMPVLWVLTQSISYSGAVLGSFRKSLLRFALY